jgi:TrmH family RNA methyltransferase
MITKRITSLQHPLVKHCVKLRKERAYREEEQSALVTGIKLIQEIRATTPIKTLITTEDPPPFPAEEVALVTPEILKKITALANPEPLAALVELPKQADLSGKSFLIALDGVSDPGNLGTLLRTALALGWEGAFIAPNSTDPFNEKALRAAKGATFRLPLCTGTWEDLDALIADSKLSVYVADMHGKPFKSQEMRPPLLLVLGNESRGATSLAKKRYTPICIPMSGDMESLNVAIAGGILMHKMRLTT